MRYLALLLLIVSCSPTAPEATHVTFLGPHVVATCDGLLCDIVLEGRNEGPGCADEVFGVTRLTDAAGDVLALGDWRYEGLLYPNAAFIYRVTGVPLDVATQVTGYRTEGEWWRVRCRRT